MIFGPVMIKWREDVCYPGRLCKRVGLIGDSYEKEGKCMLETKIERMEKSGAVERNYGK